jgi:hypothetical protein
MANRVVIGAFDGTFALRLSRPGYNVLDPALPPENLAFDSRWTSSTNLVLSGEATFVNASGVTQPITVYYGETFAVVPLVLVYIQRGTNRWGLWLNNYNSAALATVHIFTDRFQLKPTTLSSTVGKKAKYFVFTT